MDKLKQILEKTKQKLQDCKLAKKLKNKNVAIVFLLAFLFGFVVTSLWGAKFLTQKALEYKAMLALAKDGVVEVMFYQPTQDIWGAKSEKEIIKQIPIAHTKNNANVAISSVGDFAIIVWEADDEKGQRKIYYSIWDANKFNDNFGFSEPQVLSNAPTNAQPDVFVKDKNNAMVVWSQNRWQLAYSVWDGEKWSEPELVPVNVFRYRINYPTFLKPTTDKDYYRIVFSVDGKLYLATYAGGNWIVKPLYKLSSIHDRPSGFVDSSKQEMTLAWVDNLEKANMLQITKDTQEQDKLEKAYSVSIAPSNQGMVSAIGFEDSVADAQQSKTFAQLQATSTVLVPIYYQEDESNLAEPEYMLVVLTPEGVVYYVLPNTQAKQIADNTNSVDADMVYVVLDNEPQAKQLIKIQEPAYCGNAILEKGEECEINQPCSQGGVCDLSSNGVFLPTCTCQMPKQN